MNREPTDGPTDETNLHAGTEGSRGTSSQGGPSHVARGATDTPGHRLSAALTVGSRVVVRYRLAEGAEAGATDFLGELVARDDDFLVVDTKTERVKLIRADVIAAKDVPPPASRPGHAHERISADDLEKLMAKGWQALDRGGLGDWVLRASEGFTGRANSALVVGDPSLPLPQAIDFVEKWYDGRGRPTVFQVHGERGFDVGTDPVAAALLERGYIVGGGRDDWQRVLIMTGLSAAVPPLTEESVPVTADAELKLDWLQAYAEQRPIVPGATEAVLTGSEGQLFLSVTDPQSHRIIALARMAIHPGWAGIFGLWVHPDHRREGLASTLVSAVAMVARENNMPAIYLQVSADNTDGVAFWQELGFGVHHEYTYLSRPTA
ncbi:GNAT family N-acetyltransferase [Terrabacter carboxydivorans]|uniref:N-acetyltransferase domain-containing protein n=1 Tax=Terrabacter carboxydivorans TaxID=619730 RepID=A0ABN3M1C3_9MICO